MDNKKMIHVRLDENIYKKLRHICIEREISIQKYVEELVRKNVTNKKMQ